MSNPSTFTNSDVEEILRLVDHLTDVEVKLETPEFKLHVRKGAAGGVTVSEPAVTKEPRALVVAAATVAPEAAAAPVAKSLSAPIASPVEEAGTIPVKAPMLGRFYRAPSPSEPAYVEVGQHVGPDDTVCMIEVMKLFKTVNAGVSGTIVSIAVNDGDMVEDDQPLFLVKPD